MGDQPGLLSNQSPVQSGKVELKVWTDVRPRSAVYMKDFSGASYNTDTECWAVITDDGLRKELSAMAGIRAVGPMMKRKH